jgi:hypothetical protein
LIARQVPGQLRQLGSKQTPHRENEREGKQDHAHDGHSARDADALQPPDQWCEHKAQQDRHRHRNEDVATEIKRRDDYDRKNRRRYRAEQGNQFFERARFEWLADRRPLPPFATKGAWE